MILVDTSAWVEYDRATGSTVDRRLTDLIAEGRPHIPPVPTHGRHTPRSYRPPHRRRGMASRCHPAGSGRRPPPCSGRPNPTHSSVSSLRCIIPPQLRPSCLGAVVGMPDVLGTFGSRDCTQARGTRGVARGLGRCSGSSLLLNFGLLAVLDAPGGDPGVQGHCGHSHGHGETSSASQNRSSSQPDFVPVRASRACEQARQVPRPYPPYRQVAATG